MAILENEVWVKCGTSTDKYFENLGYHIPRIKNKKGKLVVPSGTKILVKVECLPEGSNAEVTKVCDTPNCGEHTPNQKYVQIINYRKDGDGTDRCRKCSSIKREISMKDNVDYGNSLEYWANDNNKEYLLEEFSDKNIKNANQISFGTNDEVLWDCKICASEYPMSVSRRVSHNQNCPYCAGTRVNHTNCLWTVYPDVAKLLKNPQRGFKITYGSKEKEDFVCGDCGFEQKKKICDVVNWRFSCSKCSDGLKYPEKFMMSVLDQIGVNYLTQYKFNWANNKKYDFYIEKINCIIEVHGGQHYGDRGFEKIGGRTFEEEKLNDEYKMRMANANNINNYIVIDCRKSELEFIKNSILNSRLAEIYNLDNIDWNKCKSFSVSSLVKTVSELWGTIGNATEIGENVNLSRYTVTKYLKQGKALSWCDYDSKEAQRQNGKLHGKQIVQLTLINGQFIRSWASATEAGNELEISHGNISSTCTGRKKSAGGYKWMYKDEYEKMIISNI